MLQNDQRPNVSALEWQRGEGDNASLVCEVDSTSPRATLVGAYEVCESDGDEAVEFNLHDSSESDFDAESDTWTSGCLRGHALSQRPDLDFQDLAGCGTDTTLDDGCSSQFSWDSESEIQNKKKVRLLVRSIMIRLKMAISYSVTVKSWVI